MKMVRSGKLFIFGLIACFIHFNGAPFAEEKAANEKVAEEKAPETIEATVRVTCEGFPVKNLWVTITLVTHQGGKEYKFKRKTDQEGSFSWSIPQGRYECRGVGTGWYNPKNLEGERAKATMIVGPGWEKMFKTSNYFNRSIFWRSRKKSVSLGPGSSALPDLEFVPRFEVLYPLEGSVVKEQLPVFKWESVEGAEVYSVTIQEGEPKEKGEGLRWRQVLREENIRSTEWKPDAQLLERGRTYTYTVKICAIDAEGRRINESKSAGFTMAGTEAGEAGKNAGSRD